MIVDRNITYEKCGHSERREIEGKDLQEIEKIKAHRQKNQICKQCFRQKRQVAHKNISAQAYTIILLNKLRLPVLFGTKAQVDFAKAQREASIVKVERQFEKYKDNVKLAERLRQARLAWYSYLQVETSASQWIDNRHLTVKELLDKAKSRR